MKLNFSSPPFQPTGAKTLAILVHGYGLSHQEFRDVIPVVQESFSAEGGVDVYAPTLPYAHRLDGTGAHRIVLDLVADLDEIWKEKSYDRIIFIGHSIGGTLLRRVFLAGAPNPPDYAGVYQSRDDLPPETTAIPHLWVNRIERIILLAPFDKGWSISARDGWKYSMSLNFLGFLGRVSEFIGLSHKPGGTMLDMRLGAPFIVQTRLQWMAYQRWQSDLFRDSYNRSASSQITHLDKPGANAVNPTLIQILGTQDDFVSPQDQVDYDVIAAASSNQKYFLLEMPGAGHADVIDFGGAHGAARKETFQYALTGDPALLQQCARDPAHFEDTPIKPDPEVTNVVFVMHGIRDDGYWTHRIAKAIKEVPSPNLFVSWAQTYGYFPMGAFLMPWVRQQKVEWFMNKYVNVKACYPNAIMHYVGHSNGTYLAASALENYPAARFGQIYFAGSVVHPKYDWMSKIAQKRVKKIHNAIGATDWVVALLPKSIEYVAHLGGAGFDGFDDALQGGSDLTQSKGFAKGQHSGAISEPHWPEIAKFIVTGEKPFAAQEPDSLFQDEPAHWLKRLSRSRMGIPLLFSLAALLVLLGFSLWLPEESRNWKAVKLTDGNDWTLWGGALISFLALQFFSKQAPIGFIKYLSITLVLIFAFGVVNFVFTSFCLDALAFSQLTVSAAERASGAVLTVVGLFAGIRFVLTKF